MPRALRHIQDMETILGELETRVFGGDGRSRKWPVIMIAAAVVGIVCLLEMANFTFFQRLEWITYDARVQLANHYPQRNQLDATNLGLVDISDETIGYVSGGKLGFHYTWAVLAAHRLCHGAAGAGEGRGQNGGIRRSL